jgi:hypothetical protein
MGKGIFKVDDNGKERFLVWSSVVDAPVSFACSAKDVVAMFVEASRERAVVEAQAMVERARECGTSSRLDVTLADVACGNRAGPDESELTEDEIIEFYVRRKKEPTAAALAAYRKTPR